MGSLQRIVATVAGVLMLTPVAMAESVEEQLRLMNERMQQLEDQLDATQDELEASQDEVERRQEVLEKAGLERQGQSGLSAFYQNVEISGQPGIDHLIAPGFVSDGECIERGGQFHGIGLLVGFIGTGRERR